MGATKLDGTAIAKSIRERLGQEIADKQKLNSRYKPSLKIIQGMCSSCKQSSWSWLTWQ
jgi:methylenetetrahydrofolate dehydrogenase (NADP+)/methenyltetrahydrofolate cyclohydrolase/formyltetrahydrofolate synthetase